MKLRTSFFDKATFKKDITRYWPIWVLYTVLLLMLMLPTVTGSSWGSAASRLNSSLETWSFGNFLYAALVSQLLFGDLFNARMCYALHAMPATRTARFVSHISAGMLFALVPDLICAVVMIPALESHLWFTSLIWLAVMILEYLCFFGIGVLSAVCTGKRLAAVAVYTILNFFSLVIYYFADTVIAPMMYGVELYADSFLFFSPVATLSTANSYFRISWYIPSENNRSYYFNGFGEDFVYLLIVAGIGAVLLAVSWLLYRRRKLESAGAFITSKWLSPVFLTLYTLCAGAFLSIFSSIFVTGSDDYAIPLIVGLIVGFFTGKMLLERTIRIFKKRTFIQFAAVVLIAVLGLWAVKTDVFGIVSFVPEVDDIEAITTSNENETLTTTKQFEAAIALHQWAVDHPCDDKCRVKHRQVNFVYTLRSGYTVKRKYSICMTDEGKRLADRFSLCFSRPELLNEDYVPNWSDVDSVRCNLNGTEYHFATQNELLTVTLIHKLAVSQSCDGQCGNSHIPFQVSYYLKRLIGGWYETDTYEICNTPQAKAVMASLLQLDENYVPEVSDIKSCYCNLVTNLGTTYYHVKTEEEKASLITIHKLALEKECDGQCGLERQNLFIGYTTAYGGNVYRNYLICDQEILSLITESFPSTSS